MGALVVGGQEVDAAAPLQHMLDELDGRWRDGEGTFAGAAAPPGRRRPPRAAAAGARPAQQGPCPPRERVAAGKLAGADPRTAALASRLFNECHDALAAMEHTGVCVCGGGVHLDALRTEAAGGAHLCGAGSRHGAARPLPRAVAVVEMPPEVRDAHR